MRRERGRSAAAGIALLMAATALLPGCVDRFVREGHLKDNPMDQAIASGIESDHLKDTRAGLLKRFPIGRPVAGVTRYLESVGATCVRSKPSDATVVCDYRQKRYVIWRTPIGNFPDITSIYDFRISLSALGPRLSGIEVCRRITRIHYRQYSNEPARRMEFPVRCPSDPKPY